MKKIFSLILVSFIGFNSFSQGCFSTGDGSDGAYLATVNTTLAGATYNFTSFTINPGVTVSITGNSALIVYCTGTVLIDGTLTASGGNGTNGITYSNGGIGGVGVAGGANGGNGSFSSSSGPLDGIDGVFTGGLNTKGSGWSGGGGAGYASNGNASGSASGGFAGISYGISDLSTFLAGSGGGGGSGGYDCGAGGGGAGGGFIYFNANNISIGASGVISSNGGNGGSDGTGNCGGGGAGSGGSIWLGALSIQNNGMITAVGGIGGASQVAGSPYYGTGGNGANGRIRVDTDGMVSGSGTINPVVGFENALVPMESTQNVNLCFGESITVGTSVYSTPGTFIDVIPSIEFGCDSTVTTNVAVQSELVSSQTLDLCFGESITVGTSIYSTPGTFIDVIPSIEFGCDSTVTTNVTVQSELVSSQTFDLCFGSSVTVGSSVYENAGTFYDLFTSINTGCDSTVTTIITEQAPIDVTVSSIVAELQVAQNGASYQWIDCDNSNQPINGEIAQFFSAIVNGNYAVEVTVNGCMETSNCFLVDFIGIEELIDSEVSLKQLVKITDLLGRETTYQPNIVLIYIYSDGSIQKIYDLK